MKPILLTIAFFMITAQPLFALEITSVYPQVASVGTPVTIIGGPFSQDLRVDLGGRQIAPQSVSSRQLVFIVPQLETGEYALFLHGTAQTTSNTASLRVELPPPAITEISPAILDECRNDAQTPVLLRGQNIHPQAQMLIDGAVVPVEREGESISFTPPDLRAGSHGVEIVNPDGKKSLAHTLWVNNVPEIDSVIQGDDFVNHYQVIITGKNFFHNSVLLITEYPGVSDLPPRQRFIPAQGGASFHGQLASPVQSDSVSYQDCHTLIYNRYPPTGQAMQMVFRVGNPDGKQTAPYEVSLP